MVYYNPLYQTTNQGFFHCPILGKNWEFTTVTIGVETTKVGDVANLWSWRKKRKTVAYLANG